MVGAVQMRSGRAGVAAGCGAFDELRARLRKARPGGRRALLPTALLPCALAAHREGKARRGSRCLRTRRGQEQPAAAARSSSSSSSSSTQQSAATQWQRGPAGRRCSELFVAAAAALEGGSWRQSASGCTDQGMGRTGVIAAAPWACAIDETPTHSPSLSLSTALALTPSARRCCLAPRLRRSSRRDARCSAPLARSHAPVFCPLPPLPTGRPCPLEHATADDPTPRRAAAPRCTEPPRMPSTS